MKTTFWSPVHGKGTTSNLLAVSLYSTLKYKMNNLITQTNFSMNHLEVPLIGNKLEETDFYLDIGIDALARSIKSAPLDQDTFYNASISLLNKQQQLHLLPGTKKSNQEYFENDMEKVINNILSYAVNYYDIVFVDTNSGKNSLSQLVLEKSDLIIVNLPQNKRVLDDYFNEYQFSSKKVFYLIGDYDRRSKNNLKNLRKQYKKMNSKNSAIIPYCTEFTDAVSDGTLIDFMQKNIEAKDDKNEYFMENVEKAVQKILRKTGWKGEV